MPDPNIIAFRKYKLAYIGICKAANTSVKLAFMSAFGLKHDNPHDKNLFNYVDYQALDGKKDWLIFSIVRHPIERIESCFKQKVWRPEGLHPGFKRIGYETICWKMPFDEFLKYVCRVPNEESEQHFRGQAYDLFFSDGRPITNMLGRMETLSKDWLKIATKIEHHCGLKLPRVLPASTNSSKNIQAPIEWTPMLKQIHYKRFINDYKRFGYRYEY